MDYRSCTAIIDPRYDTECGKPAHLGKGRCIAHLPDAPLPRIEVQAKGRYDIGVFCNCLQRWDWEGVTAPSIVEAGELAIPIIKRLLQQSAERWDQVHLQAKDAATSQRRMAVSFVKLP